MNSFSQSAIFRPSYSLKVFSINSQLHCSNHSFIKEKFKSYTLCVFLGEYSPGLLNVICGGR